jgi:hypothetical protein
MKATTIHAGEDHRAAAAGGRGTAELTLDKQILKEALEGNF